MFQVKAKIVKNIEVVPGYYKIRLTSGGIAKKAHPGQFLQIKVGNIYDPLLRRPLGIHRVSGANIEILYEIVGRGTEVLSQRKTGEYLDIIGPLGNRFDYRLALSGERLAVLVAGGMGVAPLTFLAEKIKKHYPLNAICSTLILIGAKTKSHILCEKEFRDLGCEVKIATDDGSRGFKGRVTELLKKILPVAISHKPLAIYACGPRPMLKEITRSSMEFNIPAQISLEEHLACGIGACLGCVVNTKEGYQRVCKEGPVFDAQQIIW